jgi:hypothetical protein
MNITRAIPDHAPGQIEALDAQIQLTIERLRALTAERVALQSHLALATALEMPYDPARSS